MSDNPTLDKVLAELPKVQTHYDIVERITAEALAAIAVELQLKRQAG